MAWKVNIDLPAVEILGACITVRVHQEMNKQHCGLVMVDQTNKMARGTSHTADRYTTKIIKASALLSDTKTLFALWDTSCSDRENLDRFRNENLFGKASRSRIEDILAIFRQRYLTEESVTTALVPRRETFSISFPRPHLLLSCCKG